MIEDLRYRQGSFCQIYGHLWRKTPNIGQFTCSNCRQQAYCRDCMLSVPKGATVTVCEQHRNRGEEAAR